MVGGPVVPDHPGLAAAGLPASARVVIIGGGICGASALYHLAHEGWTDTVLIEKAELTSGSTWHAAGQVTHSVSSYALAEFRHYASELYASLEDESGVATSWHRSGSLRVAYNTEEVDWLTAQLGPAQYVGNAMEWVGPRRIAALHPFYATDGMLGAVHTPDDGHADPAGAANAMVRAARNLGAAISRRNRVLGIRRRRDGSFDVDTGRGTVHAEHVVNAAGCYAHRVARMVGLDVPIANVLHTYLLTEPVPQFADLDRELPVVRTPLYGRLHDKGAVFTHVDGWERPKWFPSVAGLPQRDMVSFRHTGWFDTVAEECRAVRERVGILDATAFAKFDLIGPDAAAVLDHLTTNTVPAVGRIGLTYLLTPQARIESELTVTRLANDRLYLVSAAAGEGKDREFFETHWPDGADAELVTRSMQLGVLNVTGPAARRLLARLTDAGLSNEAFGWLRGRIITVAGVEGVRALRVGFTGELGWELHLPVEDLAAVYDALWAAGAPLGVADAGHSPTWRPSTPSPAPNWRCASWATCGPPACSARPSMIR